MIIKNSLLYIGSSLFSKAIPFLLLPFLTHYLTPEEFGKFSVYQVILAFCIALFGMAIQTNISVNYFKLSKIELSKVFGNIFSILGVNITIFFIIIMIYSFFRSSFFSIELKYLYLLIPITFFSILIEIYTTLLRNQNKVYEFVCIEVLSTIVRFIFICLMVMFFHYSWESFPLASFLTLLLFFIYCIFKLFRNNYINLKFDIQYIKKILGLSLPLIPHAIGGMLISMSDRLFVEQLVGVEAVGLYAIGFSFGMIVSLFSDAFIKAWGPWFYKQMNNLNGNVEKRIVISTYIYILGMFVSAFFVFGVSLILIPLMTDKAYHSATSFVFWIALAFSVQGIYKIFFPYLVQFSKTKYLAYTTMLAAICSVICNYYFINWFGAIGAAYSAIIAYTVSTVCVVCISINLVKLPWLSFYR